jgi:hypothetical protein
MRRSREPPSDTEIERGLRERAVTSARDAEVLLRWLQRPRVEERQLRLPNSIRLSSSRTSATMVAQMAALAKSVSAKWRLDS